MLAQSRMQARNLRSKSEEAQLELLRRRAWQDFYVFAKFVVGYNLMDEQPHRELCDFLMYGLDNSPLLGLEGIDKPITPSVLERAPGARLRRERSPASR
jgi:hypothetical protein